MQKVLISKNVLKAGFQVETESVKKQENNQKIEEAKEDTNEENIDEQWVLEIPCINLKATIQEGTSKEVMDEYIGHFEETSRQIGNIGLAAHNRGYPKNYFANIKTLKEGDQIFYKYNGIEKEYIVVQNCIIKDTDWTCLEETEENKITLITCVENQPEYRRCIQGKEIEKEREESTD